MFPLPLSMAHGDAFASRVAELKMTANETEDVFEALHRRRREGSKPNARSDGLKIGLVVEAGACAASSAPARAASCSRMATRIVSTRRTDRAPGR